MLQHKSRFKNYLIDIGSLGEESKPLANQLEELKKITQSLELVPAEQVLMFVLIYLFQRKGDQWMMPSGQSAERGMHLEIVRKINNGVRIDSLQNHMAFFRKFKTTTYLMDVAVEYRIRLLPQAIFDVLWKWGQGECNLLLWDRIPTPFEMLDYQSQGKRIVTMDLQKASRGELVDGQRDAFEFLLHDLLHADLFFKNTEIHEQQRSFFSQLKEIILCEKLLETADNLFLQDLSYLMADMNSHRAHLEAHFRAILITQQLRQEQRDPREPLSAKGLEWVQRVTI
jgi:hypothetical protein